MNNLLRLFFAIDLNDEIRQSLTLLIRQLQAERWGQQIRWVHPENMHITLRFIGACENTKVAELMQYATTLVKSISSFELELAKTRLFPNSAKPHVIGVDISPTPELFELAAALETAAVDAGFAPEARPYLPHLTIGRFVQHNTRITLPEQMTLTGHKLPVNHITLFQSEFFEGQQHYTPLHTISL